MPDPVRISTVGDIMLKFGIAASGMDPADILDGDVHQLLLPEIVAGNDCVLATAGTPNKLSHSHFLADRVRVEELLSRFHVANHRSKKQRDHWILTKRAKHKIVSRG